MTTEEIERWASAYIEANSIQKITEDHPSWWAIEQFMDWSDYLSTAEDRWQVILAILQQQPPRQVIGMVAAGPMEDLIANHGAQFIDRIELHARRDPAFRYLLGGVWCHCTQPEVWGRVEKARGNTT